VTESRFSIIRLSGFSDISDRVGGSAPVSSGLSRGFWLGLGVEVIESPDFNECGLEETLALKKAGAESHARSDQTGSGASGDRVS
jgi:hypothetical protein